MASGGAIAGAVVGVLVGLPLLLLLILYLIKRWMQGPTLGTDNSRKLDEKVAVITGCNTGIGKVTAHELSKRGAKVIMLCRNLERAEAAAEEIRADTGNVVVVVQMDLASLASVRSAAAKLIEEEDKIDLLVNNAGVMMCPETRTQEGFEMQIGTNHLGHFLLTELLIPKLRKSAASGFNSRIVIVSSLAHHRGSIRFDDLNFNTKGSYNDITAYQQSKLANVMHATALARRLENTGITVYSLHPGVIATDLMRHVESSNCLVRCFMPVLKWVIKTPFHGAQTSLYCCLEEKLSAVSGLYYSDCAQKMVTNRFATSKEDQERLWTLSAELVGLSSK